MARISRGSGLHMAGHVAGALGLYKTSHLLRGSGSAMRMFSSFGGGEGGGAGAAEVGGLAEASAAAGPAIAGVVVALGALEVGVKALEIGFKGLMSVTNDVIGAVTKLGGARGLEGMLVEAGQSESMAARIAANVSDAFTKSQVLNTIQKLSSSSEFTPEEVGELARGFIAKTGKFGDFEKMGSFVTDMASLMKDFMSTQQVGMLAGQVRALTSNLPVEDTMQIIRNLWGIGRSGAVELGQAGTASQVLSFAKLIDPNIMKGMNLEFGMIQQAQVFKGSETAAQAVTSVRRLQEQLLDPANLKRQQGLQSFLGSYLTTDAQGQRVFSDFPAALSKLVLAEFEGKLPQGLIENRSRLGLMALSQGIGREGIIHTGMTEKQKLDAIELFYRKIENSTISVDEYNRATQEVKNTIEYQLKQTFNSMSTQLEISMLPALKQMVPVVKIFADELTQNKDNISEWAIDVVAWMKALGEAIPKLLPVFGTLVTAVAEIAEKIVKFGILIPQNAADLADLVLNKDTYIARKKKEIEEEEKKFAPIKSLIEDAKKAHDDEKKLLEDKKKADEEAQKQAEEDKKAADALHPQAQTQTLQHHIKIDFATPPPPPPSRSHGANVYANNDIYTLGEANNALSISNYEYEKFEGLCWTN